MNYREEALQRTEKEIVAEKAATLGRAGERLEAALRRAIELHDALRETPAGEARARASERYRQARTRALEARRILIIQREAIGLRNHRLVDQQFPEPPRLDG
ncbi:MAG TPA: hypothetical protein VNC82_13970 [Candidatus Limnocylindria bacterium]|nr:hypothetical protein [Candidatus Limnocylindria bacterium]